MAKTNTLPITQNANNFGVQFTNSDGTTIKDVVAAGSNDTIVNVLGGQTTDTSANNVYLYLYDGTNNWPIGNVRVAAASGNDGATASVDMLGGTLLPQLSYDQNGKRVILLETGWKLRASVLAAVTPGKTLTLAGWAQDY